MSVGGDRRAKRRRQRKRERFEKHFLSPGFVYFTHQQACVVPGCARRDMDACHAVSRGSGRGTWRDVFPACHVHHMEQETSGIRTFENRHDVDLRLAADAHVAHWEGMSDVERADWEVAAAEAGYRWPAAA